VEDLRETHINLCHRKAGTAGAAANMRTTAATDDVAATAPNISASDAQAPATTTVAGCSDSAWRKIEPVVVEDGNSEAKST
jgi:hypothetical protein